MTAQDYFAHADSGGRDPIERLIAAGYLFHRRREHCVQRNHGDACRRGNFNGDGESDIFLQNSSGGRLLVWEMNGATVLSADSGSIGVNLGENGRAD